MNQVKKVLDVLLSCWKKALIIVAVLVLGSVIARKTILKPAPVYEFSQAERRDISQIIEVSGDINADQKAVLKFQATGKLGWVGVKQGDEVNKWQAIASLDKKILKKNLQKDLNAFMNQRQDFDQIREDNLVTTDNLDKYSFTNTIERLILQEQFTLNNTVLDVEIQNLTNKLATIFSPIEGIITEIDTPIAGVNVSLTDAFTVVDPATLYFEVEIDETDIGRVQLGQTAQILLEAYPDEPIASEVTWLDFAASTSDGGSTVFIAKLRLTPENDRSFRLGMTGDAIITLSVNTDVLVIPLDALEEDDDRTYVRLEQDKEIVEQDVTVGIETDDEIQILTGLSEGDRVVIGEIEQKR